jgi:hypothetical protein
MPRGSTSSRETLLLHGLPGCGQMAEHCPLRLPALQDRQMSGPCYRTVGRPPQTTRLPAVIRLSQAEFQLGILRMGKQGCASEPIEAGVLVDGLKDETPE